MTFDGQHEKGSGDSPMGGEVQLTFVNQKANDLAVLKNWFQRKRKRRRGPLIGETGRDKMCAHNLEPAQEHTGHDHRCKKCGHVWSHDKSSIDCTECHACPKCGVVEWWIDRHHKPITRDDWKTKALAATKGTQTGAILAAALNETKRRRPYYFGKASLTSDGYLIANFVDRDGESHMGAFVGAASDLRNNARGLAAHLKLNDTERAEMFAAFNGWIEKDWSGKGLGL